MGYLPRFIYEDFRESIFLPHLALSCKLYLFLKLTISLSLISQRPVKSWILENCFIFTMMYFRQVLTYIEGGGKDGRWIDDSNDSISDIFRSPKLPPQMSLVEENQANISLVVYTIYISSCLSQFLHQFYNER